MMKGGLATRTVSGKYYLQTLEPQTLNSMALSRIWAAFIITAVLVASYKWTFNNDQKIFSQMVIGKADDPYDTVYYKMYGSPKNTTQEIFAKRISGFGYAPEDSVHPATLL